MSDTNGKTELLDEVLAPWDERAWENFREEHTTAASFLLDLVNAGGTNEEIRDYCDQEGYPRRVADWLVHAAKHLRRGMAPEPEPLGPIDLPSPPAADKNLPKRYVEGPDGRGWATSGTSVKTTITTAQLT